MKSERIQYIDALRGFTMILVVFAHIETFSFSGGSIKSLLGECFQLFRMPLFFFISGFITYKADGVWNLRRCFNLFTKKIRVQLFSTLILGLLYTYLCQDKNIIQFLLSPSKLGYWFTIVLLEMFVVYYSVRFICSKNLTLNKIHLFVLIFISFLFLVLYKICPLENKFANLCCLVSLFRYFQYFIIGMFASRYIKRFFKILDSGNCMLLLLILFISSVIVDSKIHFAGTFIVRCIAGYCGLVIVFAFFRKYHYCFESNSVLGQSLQYIGKRTLDIYLLHYFIIPRGLISFDRFFPLDSSFIISFTIVFLLSILVVVGCLVLSNFIRLSDKASKYILGS